MQLRHCSFPLHLLFLPIHTASSPSYLPTWAVTHLSGRCSVGICVVTFLFPAFPLSLPPPPLSLLPLRTLHTSLPSLHPTFGILAFGIRPSLSLQPTEFLFHLAAGPVLETKREYVGARAKRLRVLSCLAFPFFFFFFAGNIDKQTGCPTFPFFPTVPRHPTNQTCGILNLHYKNTYPPELD
ncbi:uncharacterized protein LY79DRAFT_240295 [Colletotrichum navitas]|uniref:Uncharacterized protein n=1 Tax=Colletotrichum navitas TaxID=681940 RepID=A0AAD8PXR1_9PEZI|nr:uncharacterized protein LY79DRAFT_240295 [Colletotrichum navitas]KAK1586123.1 hypothetical protein LY79DRAFT_240295 [Colletotrichum navitas]